MEKEKVYKFFISLDSFLREKLSPKKESIIKEVRKATPKGGEPEGNFTKIFLAPLLEEYFKKQTDGLVIEGINSQGRTQFKNTFLGSKPAPDFAFSSPILVNVIGEVKYALLSTRSFATALGQLMIYVESSKLEQEKFDYGYMIFFDISQGQKVGEPEQKFIKDIWDKENIFITII